MNARPQLSEVPKPNEDAQTQSRSFWDLCAELRKRKVCRTAISYVLVMWLNLQIGDVVFPMVGLPDWSLSLIIVIGIMGFPIVLILAWAFQVTPEGIVLDGEAPRDSATDQQLSTLINLLLLVFAVVLSVLLIFQFVVDERRAFLAPAPPSAAASAVVLSHLSFEAATARSEELAERVHAELKHQLINLDAVELLPASATRQPEDARRRIALSGSVLLEDNQAHVLAHLIDLSAGRYLLSVAFDLDASARPEVAAADQIMEALNRALFEKKLAHADSIGSR